MDRHSVAFFKRAPDDRRRAESGLDELDYTLSLSDRIAEFERSFEDAGR